MDSLPVELVRLIFHFCDPDAVRALRAASAQLADLGYDYLVPPLFRALPWRDDVKRLHALSSQPRLRGAIESALFNFSHLQANGPSLDAWDQAEQRRSHVPALDSQADLVHEAFARLPNLKGLKVTFTETPIPAEGPLLHHDLGVRECRKMDRKQACANLNVLVSAASAVRLSSLEIDRLPLELFKLPPHRQHWFKHSPALLANLKRLDVTVDPSEVMLPNAMFRAINGFGHFLQFAVNLEQLSIGFHNHASPRHKFPVWFSQLFGAAFAFKRLTDLKLEGVSCDEHDLRRFLERHGSTLRCLSLGGDLITNRSHNESSGLGGIHLGRGTFRSLFSSLRTRLPHLERVHLQGDFECGMLDPSAHEKYHFQPVPVGGWDGGYSAAAAGEAAHMRGRLPSLTTDGLEFERYMLRGGEYPGTPARSPSPQSS